MLHWLPPRFFIGLGSLMQWDYTLYDYRGISLDSLTSYGAADFTNATGLNLQGQPGKANADGSF